MEISKADQEAMDRAMDEYMAWQQQIDDENDALIASLGEGGIDDFRDVMDDADLNGRIEIVDEPGGKYEGELIGHFTDFYVDQWTTNMEGDSWNGFIYAKVADGRFWKIPFKC